MPIAARILLVLLLVAAVPLRGYAAESASACGTHHGAAAQSAIYDHSAGDLQVPHHHESDGAIPASVCSACAGCCAGPSQALGAVQWEPFGPAGADRIAYLGNQVPVHVPGRLDRPPLAL